MATLSAVPQRSTARATVAVTSARRFRSRKTSRRSSTADTIAARRTFIRSTSTRVGGKVPHVQPSAPSLDRGPLFGQALLEEPLDAVDALGASAVARDEALRPRQRSPCFVAGRFEPLDFDGVTPEEQRSPRAPRAAHGDEHLLERIDGLVRAIDRPRARRQRIRRGVADARNADGPRDGNPQAGRFQSHSCPQSGLPSINCRMNQGDSVQGRRLRSRKSSAHRHWSFAAPHRLQSSPVADKLVDKFSASATLGVGLVRWACQTEKDGELRTGDRERTNWGPTLSKGSSDTAGARS